MPLSKEEMREYMKGYMQRKRAVKPVKPAVKPIVKPIAEGLTGVVKPLVKPVKPLVKPVKPDVIPEELLERAEGRDPQWVHLAEYIQGSCPGMPRLERMQRIAGSLGRYAGQVYFGLGVDSAISMEEVGKVIGVLPPLIGWR